MENRIIWQVTKGCSRVSGGCDSCPSYLQSVRTGEDYSIQLCPDQLAIPTTISAPKIFAVAFGSDLFHESVPLEFIKSVFAVMNDTPNHGYEVLTKRIERAEMLAEQLEWSANIAMGVVVESGEYDWRIGFLQKIPARQRYVSAVPLLGEFGDVDLSGISHVGASQETWGLRRLFNPEWVDSLSHQCSDQGVVFAINKHYLWGAN